MHPKFKVFIFTAVFLFLGTAVIAQRGPRMGERTFTGGPGIGDLARLTEALDLNASQVAAIESILESRRAQTEAVREQLRASREGLDALIAAGDPLAVGNAVLAEHALREELEGISEQVAADFRNVLTPAQQETFDGIRTMADRRGEGRFEGPGPRGPRGPGGPGGRGL